MHLGTYYKKQDFRSLSNYVSESHLKLFRISKSEDIHWSLNYVLHTRTNIFKTISLSEGSLCSACSAHAFGFADEISNRNLVPKKLGFKHELAMSLIHRLISAACMNLRCK